MAAPLTGNAALPLERPAARLSLRANFAWTLSGNVVYAGCQWGMLVALAKLGTPEWVGQFALGLAVTAPVLLFANLQLRSVQATDVEDQYRFGHFLALRLLMLGLAVLCIAGVILISGFGRQAALVVAAVGLAKSFESISDVYYGLMQKHERMDRIAKSMMIKGPLSLAALAAGTYVTRSVAIGVAAMAVVWLGVLVLYDMRSGRMILKANGARVDGKPLWNGAVLRRLAWLALPLGVVMMLNSLNANIPRYAVEQRLGQWELGIFAALAYLQIAESTVINALGQSATPRLAAYFMQRQMPLFNLLNRRLLLMGIGMGAAGVAVALGCGHFILTLIYRPEYAEYSSVFVWLMAGAALSNVAGFIGYGLTAAKCFRVQMPLLIGESLVLTAACFLLVPVSGLMGAAIAYVIAKGCLIVFSALALRHAVKSVAGLTGAGEEASHA
ncbi:MAG TPA: lipopolysaccharide biosynthesis protein [bacterium]|jgi:O-antigen/teichoic acid export membrane protein